jgi:hypothetical protein
MFMVDESVDFSSDVLNGVLIVRNDLDHALWHLSDKPIYCLKRQIVPHVLDELISGLVGEAGEPRDHLKQTV